MELGFQFDMDWVWIAVSAIVAITASVILSRQKRAARVEVTNAEVEPEIPTLTDVVEPAHYISSVEVIDNQFPDYEEEIVDTEQKAKVITGPADVGEPIIVAPVIPTVDPLARWNSASSQWARFTFMTFAELTHVAAKNNMTATQVADIFSAYNKKLQLPGLHDANTNTYAFQRLEVTDKKVYEPDINGAADRYIAQQFPTFSVKNIA